MKEKTYTVTVTVSKDYTYRVMTNSKDRAIKEAEKLHMIDWASNYDCIRRSYRVVADWHKKEQ